MKQNITISYKANGTSELLHGPEVPFAEQRATVHGLRERGLPDEVERVEIWTRQCVKFAHQKTSHLVALAEADAAAKAKADALRAKLQEDAARHAAETGTPAK